MGLGYSSLGRGSCTCFPCNTSTKAHSSTHLWDAAKGTASSFLCPLSAPLGQPRPSHLPHHRGETRAAHRSSPKQPFLSPSFFAGLLFSELSEHMWLQHAGGSTWKWQGATSQLCNWEQGRRKALLEALLLLVGLNQLCNEIFLPSLYKCTGACWKEEQDGEGEAAKLPAQHCSEPAASPQICWDTPSSSSPMLRCCTCPDHGRTLQQVPKGKASPAGVLCLGSVTEGHWFLSLLSGSFY